MEIGKALKAAREARGLSLNDVEADIKIRHKYLEALENEDYRVLPGKVYVKGFLRNYARYLGLNSDEIIAMYINEHAVEEELEPDVTEAAPAKGGNGKRLALGLLLAGIILAVGVFAIIPSLQEKEQVNKRPSGQQENYIGDKEQTPAPEGNKENLSGEPNIPAPSPEVEGVNLTLNVTEKPSWMQVVVDGQTQFTGEVAPGQSKSFRGQERIWIKLGNAGDVEVQFNGKNIGVLGQRGDVVDKEFKAGTQG